MSEPFVDAHVHFWDPARMPYPWLADVPSIASAHGPAELRTESAPEPPEQIVFVQAECDRRRALDEVRWVDRLALEEPRIAAIVAFAPVDRGEETEAALQALRCFPRVRGIRHLIQGEADPGFARRPELIAGVRRAGQLGLSFDLCLRHPQLPAVVELVRACPETAFVLDHAGKPDLCGGRLDPWRSHVTELSRLPNVVVKLSGLVTEADHAAWTPDQLRACVEHLLGSFGPRRILFGSDWPVVKLAASYRHWLETARSLVSRLGAADRADLFAANARRVYRLEGPGTPG